MNKATEFGQFDMPSRTATTKILIVDDHPLVISGCKALFEGNPGFQILSADSETTGFCAFVRHLPDISIVDINLPDLSGLEMLRKMLKHDEKAKVVMLSMREDPGVVVRAIELGAKGFVSKSDDPRMLMNAIKVVLDGETFLSAELANSIAFSTKQLRSSKTTTLKDRELEILRLLSKGYRISEIAEALNLSYKTIANTTTILKQKLSARNHADLVRLAVEENLA